MQKQFLIIGITLILVLVGFSGCVSRNGEEGSSTSSDWSMAQSYIKNEFNNPSTVRFGYHTASGCGSNCHIFTGYVNAKNTFGLEKEYKFTITVSNSSVTSCSITES